MTVLGTLARQAGDAHRAGISGINDPIYGLYSIFDGGIRLSDGPMGEPRFVSYQTIYESNPWLYAVVSTIARGVSRLPLKVYRDLDEDVRERVLPGGSSAARRLARALRYPGTRPNVGYVEPQSRMALWYSTAVDRLVEGNALWQIHRDKDGVVGFQQHSWQAVQWDSDLALYRIHQGDGREMRLLPEDVVHYGYRTSNRSVVNGSPIAALKKTIALYDAVERHLTSFFEKGARPSAHVQLERGAKEGTIKLIRQELEKLYAGVDNAGRVAVTTGKWESITESPDNLKVIELAKQSREEICATYGVPPPLVGILDRAIMSNVRELRDHYVRDTVGPHAELMEGDFEAQVVDRDPRLFNVFTEFDLAAQLRPDPEARAKAYKDMRYVYSLNELRRRENLPPINHPDADLPWIPLNEEPIGTREEEEPEPAPVPAPDREPEEEEAARPRRSQYV